MSRLDKAKFDAAFAAQQKSEGASGVDTTDALWAMLEPALEEKGLYQEEHREHMRETTADIRSWRRARTFATSFSVIIVCLMLYVIYQIVEGNNKVSFQTLGGDGVRIAFITATFGIVFGLTALMLRGAFSASKQEEVPMLPEGAKTLIELLQTLTGRGG
jgi:hypothetical protein